MISNRTNKIAFASVLVAGALYGCGGSGSTDIPGTNVVVPISGQVTTVDNGTSSNSETVQPSAGTADPITVTVPNSSGSGTTTQTAYVPAGATVAPNTPVAGVDTTTNPIFPGITTTAPAATKVYLQTNGGAQVDTGLVLNQAGGLSLLSGIKRDNGVFVVLPAGQYHLVISGPIQIVNSSGTLTIQDEFDLNFWVVSTGGKLRIGLPTAVKGVVPANGGTTHNLSVTTTVASWLQTYRQTLEVDKSNGNLSKSEFANSQGSATFADLTPTTASFIPQSGVSKVIYSVDQQ